MPIIKESLKLSRRLNCVCGWLERLFDVKVNDWIIQREWFPNDNFTFPITDFDLLQQHPIARRELGEALGSAAALPSPLGTQSQMPPRLGTDLPTPVTSGAWSFSKEKGRESICFKQNGQFLCQYNGFQLGCVSVAKHLETIWMLTGGQWHWHLHHLEMPSDSYEGIWWSSLLALLICVFSQCFKQLCRIHLVAFRTTKPIFFQHPLRMLKCKSGCKSQGVWHFLCSRVAEVLWGHTGVLGGFCFITTNKNMKNVQGELWPVVQVWTPCTGTSGHVWAGIWDQVVCFREHFCWELKRQTTRNSKGPDSFPWYTTNHHCSFRMPDC